MAERDLPEDGSIDAGLMLLELVLGDYPLTQAASLSSAARPFRTFSGTSETPKGNWQGNLTSAG